MESDLGTPAGKIAFEDSLHGLAVFLPDPLGFCAEADVLLKGVRDAQRRLDLSSAARKPLLIVRDEIVENFFELLCSGSGI